MIEVSCKLAVPREHINNRDGGGPALSLRNDGQPHGSLPKKPRIGTTANWKVANILDIGAASQLLAE